MDVFLLLSHFHHLTNKFEWSKRTIAMGRPPAVRISGNPYHAGPFDSHTWPLRLGHHDPHRALSKQNHKHDLSSLQNFQATVASCSCSLELTFIEAGTVRRWLNHSIAVHQASVAREKIMLLELSTIPPLIRISN